MATAAPKLAPFDHKLKSDEGVQQPTIFKLRPLTTFEYLRAGEIMTLKSRSDSFEYVLQTALLGWSHFTDHEGKEIEFSRRQPENLERLTVNQASELASRVLEASAIDEDERKN